MKVALLSDGIHPYVVGGMQRHSLSLCRWLARRGVDVDLHHVDPQDGRHDRATIERASVLDGAGPGRVRSFVVAFPRPARWPGHWLHESWVHSRRAFEAFLRESSDADFVYAKGLASWKLLVEKGKGRPLPPVGVKFHGYEPWQRHASLKQAVDRRLLRPPIAWCTRRADLVFSYGGRITEIIRGLGVPDERIAEVPTGIERDWLIDEPRPTTGSRTFVFVGRHERRKGVEELRRVLPGVLARHESVRFRFVGPIPESERLEHPRVAHEGAITDTPALRGVLRDADVLACPSHAEGMPNVILEAMASGCAILATRVGAVELMVSDENGVLIPPVDEDALAGALDELMACPDDALRAMRVRSVERVKERFLWERVIDATIAAIESRVAAR